MGKHVWIRIPESEHIVITRLMRYYGANRSEVIRTLYREGMRHLSTDVMRAMSDATAAVPKVAAPDVLDGNREPVVQPV